MTAAKHALRYFQGTTDLPIVYKQEQFRMVSYTDALFGANPDNRKSTTGYLFFLGGGLISFGSKTQSLTAQSTVESELQALSYGAGEAVYLSNFLMELGFKTFSLVPVDSDSTGALSVAGNAVFSSRTKHIALRQIMNENNIDHGMESWEEDQINNAGGTRRRSLSEFDVKERRVTVRARGSMEGPETRFFAFSASCKR